MALLPQSFAVDSNTTLTNGKARSRRSIWQAILAATPGVLFCLWCLSHPLGIPPHQSSQLALPSVPSEFIKHCHELLTPPASTYPKRLSNLVTALSHVSSGSSSAVWISEPGTAASYFTGGFASSNWWLSERPLLIAITPSDQGEETDPIGDADNGGVHPNITILTAEFERARAEMISLPNEIREWVTFVPWLESQSPYEILARHVSGDRPVVIDGQVRSFIAKGLQKAFSSRDTHDDVDEEGDKRNEAERIEMEVQLIRERKDEREIGLLRCANQFTLQAIRKTRARLHIGIKESETREILKQEFVKVGLEPEDGLVLFGENAALPHGAGTDRILGKQDLVLIDVGGKWGGYVADITRTFALPESHIPKERIQAWEAVRKAQMAVRDLIASNRTTPLIFADLDVAAREIITQWTEDTFPDWEAPTGSSEPDYRVLTHRTGHGIGLDGHESPYLVQGPLGQREVQPGHVFSIEPGIYLPVGGDHARGSGGKGLDGFGARLEDCFVVVEKDGRLDGEWLSGPVQRWGDA